MEKRPRLFMILWNVVLFSGDTNLAIFRVYKVGKEELSSEEAADEAEKVANINLEPTA